MRNVFNDSGCKFLFRYCPFFASVAAIKSESKNRNPAATVFQQFVRKTFPELLAGSLSSWVKRHF